MIRGKFKVEYSVKGRGGSRARPFTLSEDLSGQKTVEGITDSAKQLLISVAADVLAEEISMGFPRDFLTFVDGRKKPIEQVNPFGRIEFIAPRSLDDVLLQTMEAIESRSKVVSGRYMMAHRVTLNRVTIATGTSSLKRWLDSGPKLSPKDVITFINIAPYARRLERYGITKDSSSGGAGSKRAPGRPNGTYRLAYRSVRRKYRRNVKIDFRMIPGDSIDFGSEIGVRRNFARGRKKSVGRAYLYPSIQVTKGTDGGLF